MGLILTLFPSPPSDRVTMRGKISKEKGIYAYDLT
jgi:hypothetical protein